MIQFLLQSELHSLYSFSLLELLFGERILWSWRDNIWWRQSVCHTILHWSCKVRLIILALVHLGRGVSWALWQRLSPLIHGWALNYHLWLKFFVYEHLVGASIWIIMIFWIPLFGYIMSLLLISLIYMLSNNFYSRWLMVRSQSVSNLSDRGKCQRIISSLLVEYLSHFCDLPKLLLKRRNLGHRTSIVWGSVLDVLTSLTAAVLPVDRRQRWVRPMAAWFLFYELKLWLRVHPMSFHGNEILWWYIYELVLRRWWLRPLSFHHSLRPVILHLLFDFTLVFVELLFDSFQELIRFSLLHLYLPLLFYQNSFVGDPAPILVPHCHLRRFLAVVPIQGVCALFGIESWLARGIWLWSLSW